MMRPVIYKGWTLEFKWAWDPIEGEYHYIVRCQNGDKTLKIKGSCQDPSGAVVLEDILAKIDEAGRRINDGIK